MPWSVRRPIRQGRGTVMLWIATILIATLSSIAMGYAALALEADRERL